VLTGHRRILLIAAAALAAAPFGASAQNTMTVNAEVDWTCHLAALPLMFGTVSILFPTANAQASIFVDCTPNTAFAVTIDNGQNANGAQRRMARIGPGFGTYMNYEIYRDAARTQRWGTSVGQTVNRVAPADGKVTLYAYGRTSGTFIAAGPFEDTVTITLTF